MFATEVLEVVAIFGTIVGVWFALLGWKLLTLQPGSRLEPDE